MIRLLADENFDQDLVRGVRRRRAGFDVIRVQDVGLLEFADPAGTRMGRPFPCRAGIAVAPVPVTSAALPMRQ